MVWRRFVKERRNLEYSLFRENAPRWHDVMADNSIFGIWGKEAQEKVELK